MKYILSALLFSAVYSGQLAADNSVSTSEINVIENNIKPRVQIVGEVDKSYSIAQRMAHYNVPGLSIAVIQNGEIRWAKGYGLADTQSNRKVTQDTLFQAGSISKPIAALAVMKLVAQGKLDLDADIRTYLKSWTLPENPYSSESPITLRHLLTHTAGTTVHGFPGYTSPDIPSTVEVLMGKGNSSSLKVDTKPGTNWRYSGGGYTLMQLVVEDVTGKPFDAFIDNDVLKPLGLTHSTYQQPIDSAKYTDISLAYDREGKIIADGWHHYPEKAAAGLWTTASDIAKYALHLQQKNDETIPLNKETVSQILTPHMGNWGLGPEIETLNGVKVFSHGGKNAGFTNDFFATVASGEGVVVMANGDNAYDLNREIEIAISEFYGWDLKQRTTIKKVDLKEQDLVEFTGEYLLAMEMADLDEYKVTVKLENGELLMDDRNRDEISHLVPTGKLSFASRDNGSTFEFSRNEKKQVDSFLIAGRWPFKRIFKSE